MKTIQLNKDKELQLPENWDELTPEQTISAFGLLKEVFEGKMSPPLFRIKMLKCITKYAPRNTFFEYLSLLIKSVFIALYYRIKLGKIRSQAYWEVWHEGKKRGIENQETITENLYRLSEYLDFAFSIDKELKVTWKKSFFSNPIPYIKLGNKSYEGRRFILGVAPFTNITAQEFSDCFDLYSGYLQLAPDAMQQKLQDSLVDKIIAILYPAFEDHNKNLVSGHVEFIAHLDPAIKFGILYWFSGIVDFYITHPDYSILFKSNKEESSNEDKVTLGMGGVVLMLGKKGYSLDCNINSFFDAQLQVLQDQLNEALGKGVTKEQLSQQTGISITDINRLV